MDILPLGDCGMILRVRDAFEPEPAQVLDEVLGYLEFLRSARLPGITELAPSYTTIALFYDPGAMVAAGADPADIFNWAAATIQTAIANGAVRLKRPESSPIEIPFCHDATFALDLDEICHHSGLSSREAIERFTAADFRVHCVGFTPGFPFLSGLPRELAIPRRSVPRKEIPAGSVAIGGSQAGIYPIGSPGGWNVIGRTPLRLFNPAKNPPALLAAGDRVRFRAMSRDEFDSATR
jgi:inhibitor of KinA